MTFMGQAEGKNVEVRFIDAQTHQEFAKAGIPPENLPASFGSPETLQTTLQIQGAEWIVVRAEPSESAEFTKTKRLTLWLRKKILVDPRELLFSLPTINDFIPGVVAGEAPPPGDILRLHEDDWRQIEFVALSLENRIDEGLIEIRRIYERERAGVGFRKCHVRKEPKDPLRGVEIRLDDLRSRVRQDARSYAGVSYHDNPSLIERGFALETGSLLRIYGQEQGNRLTAFCLIPREGSEGDVDVLLDLARKHELCLVDWCRAEKVLPERDRFQQYFGRKRLPP